MKRWTVMIHEQAPSNHLQLHLSLKWIIILLSLNKPLRKERKTYDGRRPKTDDVINRKR
ncbi:hypothetical protein HanRHA438_Chr03g0143651 [Helianthus annuus]|nr:hypothetical protein HanRHA438_Chr03g0143651 [Helianthus annuus]